VGGGCLNFFFNCMFLILYYDTQVTTGRLCFRRGAGQPQYLIFNGIGGSGWLLAAGGVHGGGGGGEGRSLGFLFFLPFFFVLFLLNL
jgi:hypothetical protein